MNSENEPVISGISVVICCYNSAARLPETLAYLKRQCLPEGQQWEVIIVNNASKDNTEQVAREHWDVDAGAPLHIVFEKQPGLSYARACGIEHAQYPLVALVDDDNWLAENWLASMLAVFAQHPAVVAAGSMIEAKCESKPPDWFERYQGFYAVGSAREGSGELDKPLPGAGLCFRKSAWESLREKGFESLLSDRKGNELSSGGDHEMGYAFMLNGGKLWFESNTHIYHFIENKRLTWDYVIRLNRGFGAQSVLLELYQAALADSRARRSWLWEVVYCFMLSVKLWLQLRLKGRFDTEGEGARLVFENQWGRLKTLFNCRRDYASIQDSIAQAAWHQ